jgi:hypothetical protein
LVGPEVEGGQAFYQHHLSAAVDLEQQLQAVYHPSVLAPEQGLFD